MRGRGGGQRLVKQVGILKRAFSTFDALHLHPAEGRVASPHTRERESSGRICRMFSHGMDTYPLIQDIPQRPDVVQIKAGSHN